MSKTYTCIIVEDEPLALKRVKGFAQNMAQLEVLNTFTNPLEALQFAEHHSIDIILLDVQMDEISGIEFIKTSNSKAQYILTTAFDQYALEGYDLNITDYLLKPFNQARFAKAIYKAISNIEAQSDNYVSGIFIKSEHKLVQVLIEDILFIEGMRDYRRFHLRDRRIMTLETFSELEKRIPSKQVCRVHKSYMVNLKAIEKIERKRVYIQDHIIPISDSYYQRFSELIGKCN